MARREGGKEGHARHENDGRDEQGRPLGNKPFETKYLRGVWMDIKKKQNKGRFTRTSRTKGGGERRGEEGKEEKGGEGRDGSERKGRGRCPGRVSGRLPRLPANALSLRFTIGFHDEFSGKVRT